MNILITGGTGFLGSYLIRNLLQSNYQIILLKRSTSTFFNTDFQLQKYLNSYSLSKRQFLEWLKQAAGKIKYVIQLYFYIISRL